MRCSIIVCAAGAAATFMLVGAQANAADFSAKFSGFEEVPAAILSAGRATLDLDLNRHARTLGFRLTYAGLSSPVTQAHIHFGREHVNGGIMVFFCSNLPNPPPGTQTCPPNGGTVTGTITAANVLALPLQNVPAGDFDALVAALRSDSAYGNIHTTNFQAGEIRGQIEKGGRDDDGTLSE
jgi:CHRD domain